MSTYERYRPSLARHMLEGYLDWYAALPDAEKCYLIVDPVVWDDMPEPLKKFIGPAGLLLDISPQAVVNFVIGDEYLSFNARFSGQETQLDIPWPVIHSVYTITRDQQPISQLGFGGYTPHEFRTIETPKPEEQPVAQSADKKPALRVVK